MAIVIKPKENYYNSRAKAKRHIEDYKGAIADYTEVIKINPIEALNYGLLAGAKENVGDLNGAIGDYTKAIKIEPRHPIYYEVRGIAKIKNGQKDEGCLDLSIALRKCSEMNSPDLWSGDICLLYTSPS